MRLNFRRRDTNRFISRNCRRCLRIPGMLVVSVSLGIGLGLSPRVTLAETPAKKLKPVKQVETEISRQKKEAGYAAEYHFSMAQAYSTDGNADRAIEEYRLALMYDPSSALIYGKLATEYVKKGMLSAALDASKEAVKRDPKYVEARLILAGLYSASHETQAAVTEYDIILKANPKHEEAAIFKSQVLAEDGKHAEGVTILTQFLKKNPESAAAYFYLGRTHQLQGQVPSAAVAFKKAMELKPGFTQAALALGYLYEEKQMNDLAIPVYKQVYDETQDPAAAARLATIHLKQEKYREAVPYLKSLQAMDPEDMNVRVKLGLVHMELKEFDQAIAIFKKIIEKVPESDRVHYYLGSLYEESKKPDLAIQELKQIRADSRLFPEAALHTAYLIKFTSGLPESKSYVRQMIEKAPKHPNFYLFQASLEEESKNVPGALGIMESTVKQFPDDEKARYYLGSLYDRVGDVDKGLGQMEAILKVNPENVDALNYIGYTWTQKGVRLDEAEKLLRRALGLRPNNGYIQDSWGWHLFIRGKIKQAVVELEKAAKLKPNEPTILEHLGDAYLRSNLREKAATQYSDAVKFSADIDFKKKIQAKLETLRQEMAMEGTSAASSERIPANQK